MPLLKLNSVHINITGIYQVNVPDLSYEEARHDKFRIEYLRDHLSYLKKVIE